MATQLKLYSPDAEIDTYAPWTPDEKVQIRLADLLPLVAMAQRRHYTWLHDFMDDEVAISTDLNDVLQAFRSVRPSA